MIGKVLLAAVALLGVFGRCLAQDDLATCDCAIWSDREIPGNRGEGMVAFYGGVSNITDCSKVIMTTECYERCMQFGVDFREEQGTCQLYPVGNLTTQCYGDVWCSRIDPTWVEGRHQLNLMVRMPDCKLHGEDWLYMEYYHGDNLCCDADGRHVACEDQYCDCRAVANFSCECGLFVPQLFLPQYRPHPNIDPLPFIFVGDGHNPSGPEFDEMCENFPTLPTDPNYDSCSSYCTGLAGEDEITAELIDPFPQNPAYTYGQIYCKAMAGRVKNFEGTGTDGWPLQVFGRLRDCEGKERWQIPSDEQDNDVPFLEYRDPLCCDPEGIWMEDCRPIGP